MNLGAEFIKKNDFQKALSYFRRAKISLEEGYEQYTEIVDGRPITKELLQIVLTTIQLIENNSVEELNKITRLDAISIQDSKVEDELEIPKNFS